MGRNGDVLGQGSGVMPQLLALLAPSSGATVPKSCSSRLLGLATTSPVCRVLF